MANGIVRAFKRALVKNNLTEVRGGHTNYFRCVTKSRIKTKPARNVRHAYARTYARTRAHAVCVWHTHTSITKRHRPRLLTSKASTEHMTPSLASRSLSERLSAGKSGWDEPTT